MASKKGIELKGLIGSVEKVNEDLNFKIIGFIFEGSVLDMNERFSSSSNGKIRKMVDIESSDVFFNKCAEFGLVKEAKGRKYLVSKGKSKIYELPKYQYSVSKNGKDNKESVSNVPMPEGIKLIGRIITSGITSHYRVEMGFQVNNNGEIVETGSKGKVYTLTVNSVINLAAWFRPYNFMVKENENENKKAKFITGKPGMLKLENLETVNIEKDVSDKSKKIIEKSSLGGGIKGDQDNTEKPESDFISLAENLEKLEASIVYLPDKRYDRTTDTKYETDGAFRPLGVGDIGKANLLFSKDKLKANIRFRCPGIVNVQGTEIITYTWKEKSLYVNNKPHVDEIGIILDPSKSADFINFMESIGKVATLSVIKDNLLKQSIDALSGNKDYEYFKVNLNDFELMSENRANKCKRNRIDTIYSYHTRLVINNLLQKASKEVKKVCGSLLNQSDDNINNKFLNYKDSMLEEMKNAGISLKNGEYTKTNPYKAKVSEDGKVLDGKTTIETNEIEFVFDGLNMVKFTGKNLVGNERQKLLELLKPYIINKDMKAFEEMVQNLDKLNKVYKEALEPSPNMQMISNSYKQIDKFNEKQIEIENKFKYSLWMYKIAMLKLGNGSELRGLSGKWEIGKTGQKKELETKDYYVCESEGVVKYNTLGMWVTKGTKISK